MRREKSRLEGTLEGIRRQGAGGAKKKHVPCLSGIAVGLRDARARRGDDGGVMSCISMFKLFL